MTAFVPTRRHVLAGATGIAAAAVLGTPRAALASSPSYRAGAASVVDNGHAVELVGQATAKGLLQFLVWTGSVTDAPTETSPRLSTNSALAARWQPQSSPNQPLSWQVRVYSSMTSATCDASPILTLPAWPTPGASTPFSLTFGSCQQLNVASDFGQAGNQVASPCTQQMAGRSPLFFAMLGDMGYKWSDDGSIPVYANFAHEFSNWIGHPQVAPLLQKSYLISVQDDHDYGRDDSAGGYGAFYQAHPEPRQAFGNLLPGAIRYSATNPTRGAYRSWAVGDVLFVLLDCRWECDSFQATRSQCQNGKYRSYLGATQRAWLYNLLRNSPARLKVVLSPVFTGQYSQRNLDGTGSGPLGERGEIFDVIETSVSGTVLFLSGNKHAAAFCAWKPGKIYELLAGPLQNNVHHPMSYSPGIVWCEGGDGQRQGPNAFGYVTVQAGEVSLAVIGEGGNIMYQTAVAY